MALGWMLLTAQWYCAINIVGNLDAVDFQRVYLFVVCEGTQGTCYTVFGALKQWCMLNFNVVGTDAFISHDSCVDLYTYILT